MTGDLPEGRAAWLTAACDRAEVVWSTPGRSCLARLVYVDRERCPGSAHIVLPSGHYLTVPIAELSITGSAVAS